MTSELSLLGQHCLVGLSQAHMTREEAQLLRQLRPAGIILFKHNIDTSAPNGWDMSLFTLLRNAQDAAERERFIVSIDHEGGKVHRLPRPVTHFPPALFWTDLSSEVGAAMGRELSSLGINLSFSPVLDTWLNPNNTVIAHRAFSKEPEGVWPLASGFLEAMEANGVLGCLKHFPGHGATTKDSHFELPHNNASYEELLNSELIPFVQAIKDQNTSMIMTSHVMYPKLDRDNPATLSREIISLILRNELGYDGVVITDALEMNALASRPTEHNCEMALLAGADLLLFGLMKASCPCKVAMTSVIHMLRRIDRVEAMERAYENSNRRLSEYLNKLTPYEAPIEPFAESSDNRKLCEELSSRARDAGYEFPYPLAGSQ